VLRGSGPNLEDRIFSCLAHFGETLHCLVRGSLFYFSREDAAHELRREPKIAIDL
jgi:hypothetical protein